MHVYGLPEIAGRWFSDINYTGVECVVSAGGKEGEN